MNTVCRRGDVLTVPRMKRHSAITIAAVTLVALSACTRSAQHSPASPEALADALLMITDLGAGWDENQRQFFDQRGNENPSLDATVFCVSARELAAPLTEMAGQSGADVEMSYDTAGSGARYLRQQAWTSGDVMEYVDAVAEVVGVCDGTTETDGVGVTTTTELIEDRVVGDESVSWSTRTIPPAGVQDQKFEAISRVTVARFGDAIMVMQVGDANVVGSAAPMDEDDWWAMVTLAADGLDDLGG